MEIEVLLEYRCGHPLVTLVAGKVNPRRLTRELKRLMSRTPKTTSGKVACGCPKCGRGAGWITIKVAGKAIYRESVDQVARSGLLAGADLSLGPDQENN